MLRKIYLIICLSFTSLAVFAQTGTLKLHKFQSFNCLAFDICLLIYQQAIKIIPQRHGQ